MFDVRFVLAHGLWIHGVAIVLAAFSYYNWLAASRRSPLREILRLSRGWKLSVGLGLWLVATGMLLMEGLSLWERGGWMFVWACAAANLWRLRRSR
jgi:hypothetical protein